MYRYCHNFTLEKDGCQVIENVVSESKLIELRQLMWQWLEYKTQYLNIPVEKSNPASYRSLFQLYPKHGMLFQHWDFGHNPISWALRQDENVIQCFRDIWKTDRLLTSFDGISISLPCEVTGRGWTRGNEWFHSDQCFQRNDFECVQGLVNLYDVNDGDGTLRVLRSSHTLHKDFQQKFQIQSTSDWLILNQQHKKFYMDILGKESDICIKAKAGSLVLWDSRTIHQGMEPLRGREKQNIRCVPYICMTPASFASPNQLKKRIKYFKDKRTCNHWPHKIKPFSRLPRTYGNAMPKIAYDDVQETILMRKLVGY